MGKRTFDRWTNFEYPIKNEEVLKLQLNIQNIEYHLETLRKKLDEIQSNCNHQYKFSSQGMYDDTYRCSECGHETEN